MSSFIEFTKDITTGDIVGRFKITKQDMVLAQFDSFDRAVMNTPHETAADIAQDLELIFRRIHEAKMRTSNEQLRR